MNALQFAMAALKALPALLAAGQDIMSLISHTNSVLTAAQAEGRDPSPAEWESLNFFIQGEETFIDAA